MIPVYSQDAGLKLYRRADSQISHREANETRFRWSVVDRSYLSPCDGTSAFVFVTFYREYMCPSSDPGVRTTLATRRARGGAGRKKCFPLTQVR